MVALPKYSKSRLPLLIKRTAYASRRYYAPLCAAVAVVTVLSATGAAYATIDPYWTVVLNQAKMWVNRIGAAILFVGAVRFGLGWQSEDAGKKSQGISVIIAGAIVIALTNLAAGFASTAPTATQVWSAVGDILGLWIPRLGGVFMFIGGIMFGLAWKGDDAQGKSRSISTIAAGGIVVAIGAAIGLFW